MQNVKITLLTLLFFTGFIIPSCNDDGIDCSGCPDDVFFNVTGLDVDLLALNSDGATVSASDTLSFENLDQIYLDYEVDYHACIAPSINWSLGLMNTAMACSCISSGGNGSKTEKLTSLSIITLNDFDDEHPAGTSINDLMEYFGGMYGPNNNGTDLEEYLADVNEELLEIEDIILRLTKAPAMDTDFQIKVTMELSTGETYEVESLPVYLRI